MICVQIHEDVLARLDAAKHRTTCENCEDGYCYDCILLEMTDAEYAVDTVLLTLQRLEPQQMMVRIHCDYDAGMPLSYRGVAIEQDGREVVRYSADGCDADVRQAMRHVVEQFDTNPSLASSLCTSNRTLPAFRITTSMLEPTTLRSVSSKPSDRKE
jgi:hypothetical protein